LKYSEVKLGVPVAGRWQLRGYKKNNNKKTFKINYIKIILFRVL